MGISGTAYVFEDNLGSTVTPPVVIPPEPPVIPPPTEPPITDRFNRTVAVGLGTSDAGIVWASFGTTSVDGSRAVLSVPGSATSAFLNPVGAFDDLTVTCQSDGTVSAAMLFFGADVNGGADFVEVDFRGNGYLQLYNGADLTGVDTTLAWGNDVATKIRMVQVGETVHAYVWQASGTMPGSPTLSLTSPGGSQSYGTMSDLYIGGYDSVGFNSPFTAYFDDLDVIGFS